MKTRDLILCLPLLAALMWGCSDFGKKRYPTNAARIVAEMHDPASDYVMVISHRGDWRNHPENSIAAIESVIEMGVDIMELDLKLTGDSVLVLCHDRTIDRTTTGKGRVSDITYDSISRCFLRGGHGVATTHKMPTFKEALECCRGRIVVNVDHAYQYYDLVLAVAEEVGVVDQILIKGKFPTAKVAEDFARHEKNLMYMPVIDILKPRGEALFAEYIEGGIVPLAYEVCWDKNTPEVEACMRTVVESGSKLWVNSLWASLCGGLNDDVAFDGNADQTYGRLLDMGASMIQTDRPQFLIDYLRSKGRR